MNQVTSNSTMDTKQATVTEAEADTKELDTYTRWRTSLFGRRSKLTPKTKRKILFYARQGHKDVTICKLVNIHPGTFYKYLNLYSDFSNDFERAREAGIARKVQGIEKQGSKDWKALAWLLGKQQPQDYGDINNVYFKQNNQTINLTFDGTGYIPPDNVLGLKPTSAKSREADIVEDKYPDTTPNQK